MKHGRDMHTEGGMTPEKELPAPGMNAPQSGTEVPDWFIRIRDEAIAWLIPNLHNLFDALDDALFERASTARSNTEQNQFFDAMREFRIQRRGIEQRFRQRFVQNFYAVLQPGPEEAIPSASFPDTKLGLVPDDALEESLALNNMASRSRANLKGPLHEFKARMNLGLDLTTEGARTGRPCPLDPEILAQSIAQACCGLDIRLQDRLLFYKEFERQVMVHLGEILELGNRILERAGIPYQRQLPERQLPERPLPERQISARTLSQGTPNPEPVASLAPQEYAGSRAQLMLSLLQPAPLTQPPPNPAQRALAESQPPCGGESQTTLSLQDLLGILTRLQRQSLPDEPGPPPKPCEVRQLLIQQAGGPGRLQLSARDEGLIDLVSLLFEFILSDERLTPPLRALIGRLQIPVLKIVLQDRSFFRDPSHPARRLLNDLARAGIGWSDASDRKRDQLFDWIQNVVQRILNEFDGDLSLFQELSRQFAAVLEREEHKARLVEQRTRQAEEGRIRMERTQALIDRVLHEKIAGRPLPPFVENLLCTDWSRLMFIAYLQDDRQHRWHLCLEVIDELLCCLFDRPATHQRQRVTALLGRLRSGLQEVCQDHNRLERQLQDLEQLLLAEGTLPDMSGAASNPWHTQAHPSQTPVPATSIEMPHSLEPEDELAEYRRRIERIPTGTWLEFSLVNGSTFRCKLSARIDGGTRYIFVNRVGLKMLEKSARELAQELYRDRIRILKDKEPLLEGAIRGLADRLQFLATQTV